MNIAKKKLEMENKLQQYLKEIEAYTHDVTSDEAHIIYLKHNTDQMDLEAQKLQTAINEMNAEFHRIQNLRKDRFNECLAAINQEIANFCRIALKGQANGELKATNSEEPFTGGVQFNWRAGIIDAIITEKDRNYDAAFAFLMGIIK